MSERINVLDVVALTADLPDRGLVSGQVGTVVEALGEDTFEVEFVDDSGHTYALCAVAADHLLVLHYRPLRVA
jgi:catabolite regulation protein CreA